jgi:hypothetical protein
MSKGAVGEAQVPQLHRLGFLIFFNLLNQTTKNLQKTLFHILARGLV